MPHPVASTKSGLPIQVAVIERQGERVRAAREHPLVVRLTHWANAVSLVILTMSGLQIFAAFPSFGPKVPQSDLVVVPEALRLGGWLGGALQWHFTFAWLFAATGVVYVLYLAATGHWRHVVLRPDEIGDVWPTVTCRLTPSRSGRGGVPCVDGDVVSVRVPEGELPCSSVRVHVRLLFEPGHESTCSLECHVEIVDAEEQEEPIARWRLGRTHQGGMLVRAPPVEAEQDGSIRIQDLTKMVMARRRFGLAKERLVPFEATRHVPCANDRPCAFHRISAPGITIIHLQGHASFR
jgi:hypothetical protein